MAQDLVKDDPHAFIVQVLTDPTSKAHPATHDAVQAIVDAIGSRENEILRLSKAYDALVERMKNPASDD